VAIVSTNASSPSRVPCAPSGVPDRVIKLLAWSRRVSGRIERAVLGNYSIETVYREAIASLIDEGALVLDAGAGKRCIYGSRRLRVIGSDMSLQDLRGNADVQLAVVTDLGRDFPFRLNSLDAVTACYFVEHIRDSEQFIRNVANALRPGGRFFLLFPCRYAPFAVINRMISNKFAVTMLRWFVEDSQGGFPAMYNNCWPRRMRDVLKRNGLNVLRTELCFYQSHYYASFLPVYVCSLAYDMLMKAFAIESMAASAYMFGEKSPHTERLPPANAGATS
jgi:SAM-dependent methyltransferase